MNIMSYMKKKYIKILPLIVTSSIIIVVISILVITIIRKKEYFYFIIQPSNYYLPNNNLTLNIELYSNHQNDYYLNKDTIEKLLIKDKVKNDFYMVKINQIVAKENTIKYNNKYFYKYLLKIKIPIKDIDFLQISQAILEFYYLSTEQIKLDIGSIIIYNECKNHHIHINHLKGIVNQIDQLNILSGIGLTLSSDVDLEINNIVPLDRRIKVQGRLIKKLKEDNYDNFINMSDLLDNEYKVLEVDSDFPKIILNKNIKNHYLIPLGYEEIFSITILGFIIDYSIDGINYQQLINPFKFYNTSFVNYQVTKYEPNIYS